jgi:hypothetical protein
MTKAKIDTGARTCALHAFNLAVFSRDGDWFVRFDVHPAQRTSDGSTTVERPVVEFRRVRSSTGHAERRPVIRTPIQLGQQCFDVDITLTSRDEMGFRMLIGRAALRKRFVVDPARSFLGHRARTRPVKKAARVKHTTPTPTRKHP